MRLVYTANQQEVRRGDEVEINGAKYIVDYFRQPHSPASSGKVTVRKCAKLAAQQYAVEYYVEVIGAEWIEREDRS